MIVVDNKKNDIHSTHSQTNNQITTLRYVCKKSPKLDAKAKGLDIAKDIAKLTRRGKATELIIANGTAKLASREQAAELSIANVSAGSPLRGSSSEKGKGHKNNIGIQHIITYMCHAQDSYTRTEDR